MDLYSENILHYAKNKQHLGKLKDATITGSDANPLCGDKVEIFLKVNKEGLIEDAMFDGEGCAISVASTAMLIESIIGKDVNTVMKMTNDDIYKMLGIEISSSRVKCALLGFVVLQNTLAK